MNPTPEHLIRSLRQIALSDASYTRIRSALESYADIHAVPDGAGSAAPVSVLSGWMRTRQAVYAFSLVGIFILGGGTATLGAERALPGDVLYPLKIHVNEAFSVSFADTVEEKAQVHAALAERRAEEGVKLAIAGKLDAATADRIGEEVARFVEASDEDATALEATGDIAAALRVRTELEGRLAAHARALESRETAPAAEAADTMAVAMIATKMASDEPPTAEAVLAGHFYREAGRLNEARIHSENAVLPGFASVNAADLGIIRTGGASEAAVMITASAVAEADEVAGGSSVSVTTLTVIGTSTVQVETSGDATVRIKERTRSESHESIWLNVR